MMIKYITRFIKSLNANTHPGDIAHAVAIGLLLALVPQKNLLWPVLFIVVLFIRINKGAFFLSLILLSFVVPLFDVPVERLGYFILTLSFLQPFFNTLYQTPFIGLTQFNNTMVTGSLIAALIAYVPVYLLARILVSLYRKKLQPFITNSKVYKMLMRFPLIKKIKDASGIGGLTS